MREIFDTVQETDVAELVATSAGSGDDPSNEDIKLSVCAYTVCVYWL